jgi:kynureninase
VGLNLAHAAGNLLLSLHDWDVDFAVWCSYKYLNSGPGNLAGCFVHERHARSFELPRFAGWWGHNKQTRLHSPSRSLAQRLKAVAIRRSSFRRDEGVWKAREATMPAIREKSIRLTGYLNSLDGRPGSRRSLPRDPNNAARFSIKMLLNARTAAA